MNTFQKILGLFGITTIPKPVRNSWLPSFLKRGYAAANINRITNDWRPSSTSADYDIKAALVSIRDKARDLCQNNDYGRKFLRMCRKNIPGAYGFQLHMKIKMKSGELDTPLNNHIKEQFKEWGRREFCTVTGQLSWRQAQHIALMHLVRDGELLVRKIYQKSSKFGYKMQILEPDLLDEKFNEKLSNGNMVRMGVEIDAWRKPIAYHLKVVNPETELYSFSQGTGERERILARDIYHYFDRERSFQTRGISWLAAGMLRLRMLSAYEEAALINARIGASKMGFFYDESETTASYQGTEKDSSGNEIVGVEPGQFEDIGRKRFTPFNPDFPDAQHGPFVESMGRGISSGFDVSYHTLFNDLTSVNYSSIRHGMLDERETWTMMQEDFIEGFLELVFRDWLEMSYLKGAVILPSEDWEIYNIPYFIGKRWGWVDPESDMNAKRGELDSGMTSLTRVCAERGDDLEEILAEIKDEKMLFQKYGVTVNYAGTAKPVVTAEVKPTNGKSVSA